jgi:hypothetical protein
VSTCAAICCMHSTAAGHTGAFVHCLCLALARLFWAPAVVAPALRQVPWRKSTYPTMLVQQDKLSHSLLDMCVLLSIAGSAPPQALLQLQQQLLLATVVGAARRAGSSSRSLRQQRKRMQR